MEEMVQSKKYRLTGDEAHVELGMDLAVVAQQPR